MRPLFFYTSVICLCILLKFDSVAVAQTTKAAEARQVLIDSRPLFDPGIEVNLVDSTERKTAIKKFSAQINALQELCGCEDNSLIPIVIPFLHYTKNASLREIGQHAGEEAPDVKAIAEQYPAFAIIIRIPMASVALKKYISDSKNSVDYRIAALHVLRYIDRKQFDIVCVEINKEFSRAGRQTKSYLEAIEQKNAVFRGINPIDVHQ